MGAPQGKCMASGQAIPRLVTSRNGGGHEIYRENCKFKDRETIPMLLGPAVRHTLIEAAAAFLSLEQTLQRIPLARHANTGSIATARRALKCHKAESKH